MLTKVFMLALLALPLTFTCLSPIFLLWSGVIVFEGAWPDAQGSQSKPDATRPVGLAQERKGGDLTSSSREDEYDEEYGRTASRRLLQQNVSTKPFLAIPCSDDSSQPSRQLLQATTTAAAVAATTSATTAAAGAAPPKTRNCHVEINIDYHGHDIGHTSVADVAGCCKFCSSTPGCCYFTFKPAAQMPATNCWAKPFFINAKARRVRSTGHNSGHFEDGHCHVSHHKNEIEAFNRHHKKLHCGKTSAPMLKMWTKMTLLLACGSSLVLVVLVVLDLIFSTKDEGLDSDNDESLIRSIETGRRPMLGYLPFLLTYLRESSDDPFVATSPSSISSMKMHEVINSVWAVGIDLWFALGVLLQLSSVLCASHIPSWWMLLLLLLFWAGVAVLVLLYGLKRAILDKEQQRHVVQKRAQPPPQTPKKAAPYTPMREWNVQDLVPNPNDQRYTGYNPTRFKANFQ